jgi:hypothetical protein
MWDSQVASIFKRHTARDLANALVVLWRLLRCPSWGYCRIRHDLGFVYGETWKPQHRESTLLIVHLLAVKIAEEMKISTLSQTYFISHVMIRYLDRSLLVISATLISLLLSRAAFLFTDPISSLSAWHTCCGDMVTVAWSKNRVQ